MYDNHQALISDFARQNPDNFAKVLQFVILTIRRPLRDVPIITEIVEQGGPDARGVLFGWKFQAFQNVWEKRRALYGACERYATTYSIGQDRIAFDKLCAGAMIASLADQRGFGPVKAGFAVQLIYGLAGCIDTHNLKRFNIPPRTFDNYGQLKTDKARADKVRRYVDTCYALGGPKVLWDGWCQYVATNQPALYESAEQVSALHCVALGIEPDAIPF